MTYDRTASRQKIGGMLKHCVLRWGMHGDRGAYYSAARHENKEPSTIVSASTNIYFTDAVL